MQKFENKYGSDMVRAIEGSYNLHFKPSGRTATTIKKEDMAPAYSALLNDVASSVRMGDTKSELSVNVPVMIDDYLKARGVEISRKKTEDPAIKVEDSHVAVESEEAPAKTDEDMVKDLLKSYKGKTLEPSTIMKKLKVDGPKARDLAEMYKKARAEERISEKAEEAPITPVVKEKKPATPEMLKTEPEAAARADEDMVNELLNSYKGKTLAPSTIMKKLKVDGPKARELAEMYKKARAEERTSEEAEEAPKAPVVEEKKPATPEETAEEPTPSVAEESEKKDAAEEVAEEVAAPIPESDEVYAEAEPEDDGWQKLTKKALEAGVPEVVLKRMRESGMPAEDAFITLKKGFPIAADKDKEDSDEPGSGA